jgi:hypothetical protein
VRNETFNFIVPKFSLGKKGHPPCAQVSRNEEIPQMTDKNGTQLQENADEIE